MDGRAQIVDGRVIVETARIPEHEMTENLFGHMEDLREILDGIPPLHRGSAKIGIWGESDLVVTYERPATPEEIEAERAARRHGVRNNWNWIRAQIDAVLREAAKHGVDPSELGISVEDESYVITRQTS